MGDTINLPETHVDSVTTTSKAIETSTGFS